MADGGTTPHLVEDFITHWSKAEASERANAQPFLIGLAKILGVTEPSNSHADGYTFEFPVKIPIGSMAASSRTPAFSRSMAPSSAS